MQSAASAALQTAYFQHASAELTQNVDSRSRLRSQIGVQTTEDGESRGLGMLRCQSAAIIGAVLFLCALSETTVAGSDAPSQKTTSFHLIDDRALPAGDEHAVLKLDNIKQLTAADATVQASKTHSIDTEAPPKDTALPFPPSLWPALLMLALLAIARRFRWRMA